MKPASVEELQEIIRTNRRIQPAGAGSKTALSTAKDGIIRLSAAGLSGILEYEPNEYTITVLAGTPAADIERTLAEYGQYLPFDPPMAGSGATLGGTVAAGLNGPGRYRFGGLRDSLLGVRYVDSRGGLVRSGGKVVKNAAGFDLSKFMVGSLGCYGMLVELSFKVMPAPLAYATLRARYPGLESGLEVLVGLACKPLEIYALELVVNDGQVELLARVGGAADTMDARTGRMRSMLDADDWDILEGAEELAMWQELREFRWLPEGASLVKVPLTPRRVWLLEQELSPSRAPRVYSAGANLAWIAWHGELDLLEAALLELDLNGLVVLGKPGRARLGMGSGESFARRIKQALDPDEKFVVI